MVEASKKRDFTTIGIWCLGAHPNIDLHYNGCRDVDEIKDHNRIQDMLTEILENLQTSTFNVLGL